MINNYSIIPPELIQKMAKWREHLHSHPELGLQEEKTSQYLLEELKKLPFTSLQTGIGGFGIVATLEGKKTKSKFNYSTKLERKYESIGLRADMDALPLHEENDFSSKSQNPGIMHACGHDAHMTMLLGAAHYLALTRNFSGTCHFIFQPGEEGLFGAKKMLEDGLMEKAPMDAIFGMHVWPELPCGMFALKKEAIFAFSDMIEITLFGQGGHAAQPHLGPDPIVALSELILSLQTIISRTLSPLEPAVLSITEVKAGTTHNIIPDRAYLRGTCRSLNAKTRAHLEEKINHFSHKIAELYSLRAEVKYVKGYPATINHDQETEDARKIAENLVGQDKVIYPTESSLGGEDFSYFLEKIPGSYFFIGAGNPKEKQTFPLHHPKFYCPSETLHYGASYWIHLIQNLLISK